MSGGASNEGYREWFEKYEERLLKIEYERLLFFYNLEKEVQEENEDGEA